MRLKSICCMPLHDSRTYVHSEKGKFSYIEKILCKIKGAVTRRLLVDSVRASCFGAVDKL